MSSPQSGKLYAAFDLGTGSLRGIVARLNGAGGLEVVHRFKVLHGIGGDLVKTGAISPATLDVLLAGVRACLGVCSEMGVDEIFAAGTASLRDARNGAAVLEVLKACGLPLVVIDGFDELRLSMLGCAASVPDLEEVLFVDSGAGSTELAYGNVQQGSITHWVSLPLGCSILEQGLYEADVTPMPLVEGVIARTKAAFGEHLQQWPQRDLPLLVAGTPASLLLYLNKAEVEDLCPYLGQPVTLADARRALVELCAMGMQKRRTHPHIHSLGDTLMIPATAKLIALLEITGKPSARLVPSGIVGGLILQATKVV